MNVAIISPPIRLHYGGFYPYRSVAGAGSDERHPKSSVRIKLSSESTPNAPSSSSGKRHASSEDGGAVDRVDAVETGGGVPSKTGDSVPASVPTAVRSAKGTLGVMRQTAPARNEAEVLRNRVRASERNLKFVREHQQGVIDGLQRELDRMKKCCRGEWYVCVCEGLSIYYDPRTRGGGGSGKKAQ